MEQEPAKPEKSKWDEHIEKRARDLGLPTDPAAYQDGGLAAVAAAYTISEADLIASVLNSADIPAWVDAPRSAVMLWYMQAGTRAGGIKVLVPLGRLKDAQEILGKKPAPPSEEAEHTKAETLKNEAKRLLSRGAVIALFLLPVAIYVFVKVVMVGLAVHRERLERGHCEELGSATTYLFFAAIVALPGVVLHIWLLFTLLAIWIPGITHIVSYPAK